MEVFGQVLLILLLVGLGAFVIYQVIMLIKDIIKRKSNKKDKNKSVDTTTDRKE